MSTLELELAFREIEFTLYAPLSAYQIPRTFLQLLAVHILSVPASSV